MKKKIEYDPEGFVVLNNTEWRWEDLKQACYSDYVYEARPRGTIVYKYKVPKEILNEWIQIEEWEKAKKSFWQRPISYRLDSNLAILLQNVFQLKELQLEVNDIPFEENEIENRVTISIDISKNGELIPHKKIILEKYKILIADDPYEWGHKVFQDHPEIRYKTVSCEEDLTIKYRPVIKSKKN